MGAIAVPDARANAVGPVRLTCLPSGLRVELLRVGRFAAGFAFVGLADAVTFEVPYRAVRGMLRQGTLLHLSLDPHAAAPFNRFALTRFGHDPMAGLLRIYRLRAWLRAAARLLPPVVAALAGVGGGDHASGWLGRGAVALVAGALAFVIAREAAARLTDGGARSAELADAFERAVSVRLGLRPA